MAGPENRNDSIEQRNQEALKKLEAAMRAPSTQADFATQVEGTGAAANAARLKESKISAENQAALAKLEAAMLAPAGQPDYSAQDYAPQQDYTQRGGAMDGGAIRRNPNQPVQRPQNQPANTVRFSQQPQQNPEQLARLHVMQTQPNLDPRSMLFQQEVARTKLTMARQQQQQPNGSNMDRNGNYASGQGALNETNSIGGVDLRNPRNPTNAQQMAANARRWQQGPR